MAERLQGSTVLLVEDDSINQKVMSHVLCKWGIRVILAENGEQAVDKVQENPVNLVLMDLQLPKMDGFEATLYIRGLNEKPKAQIPIIALTANAFKEVKEKVLASGMNDCLTKPLEPAELQKKLEFYLLKK